MKKYILTIDQGTTSTRTIIFDEKANIVCMNQMELELISPYDGYIEHNPKEIWEKTYTTIANVLTTLYFKNEDYDSLIAPLNKIIKENNISKVVLGLPKNMNNTLGQRAIITLEFKKKIEENINIEVVLEDERLTSVISNNIMIEADLSRKKRKKKKDGLAAVIILQNYLDKKGE